MSTAAIVIMTVILTLGAVGIGFIIYKSRKDGDEVIPWDKIRPILTEVIKEVIELRKADSMGYQALEDYVVNIIREKIDESAFLIPEEKDLLNEELIRGLIKPQLEKLYDKD